MNCEQAKQYSIIDYLMLKSHKWKYMSSGEYVYFAPYRKERTPSFFVSKDGHAFNDFGSGGSAKGNIIDLAMQMIGTSSISEALRDIERTMGAPIPATIVRDPQPAKSETRFTVRPITDTKLLRYAASRGISAATLERACVEVGLFVNDWQTDPYLYIGFRNDTGGYELRSTTVSKYQKRTLGKKDITTIGEVAGSTCLAFEGFFDYLSAVELGWMANAGLTAVVLNTTAMKDKAIPTLLKAKEVHLWLDNDNGGKEATDYIMQSVPTAIDYSYLLPQGGDVNDFLKK